MISVCIGSFPRNRVVSALLVCTIGLFGFGRAFSISVATGSGARQPAKAQAASNIQAFVPASDSTLLIESGDLLEISVFGVPDYVRQVRVSESGQVTLPFIGEVTLVGISVGEAEKLVAKQLSDMEVFRDPQVIILEKEYSAQDITILGEVQKPGIYSLAGKRTLFDAISAAGGTSTKAGDTVIITHRDRPLAPESIKLSYDASGSPNSNVPVLPGDTVAISKAGIVYVVGDVRVPTGVVLENSNLTVLKAIAMAQGLNPTASQDKTRIIRRTPDGQQQIPIPLKKILSAQAPDPKLQPDDIVFVPSSAAKSAGRRGLEAVIQAATGVAIYSRYY